jgi:hypothetical protein
MGPFQWVAGDASKKIASSPRLARRVVTNVSNSHGFSSSRRSIGERERDFGNRNIVWAYF